jgi:hypothetical protein
VLSCSLALLRVGKARTTGRWHLPTLRRGLDERALVVPLAPGPLGRRSVQSACEKELGTGPAVSREVLRPVGNERPNANGVTKPAKPRSRAFRSARRATEDSNL